MAIRATTPNTTLIILVLAVTVLPVEASIEWTITCPKKMNTKRKSGTIEISASSTTVQRFTPQAWVLGLNKVKALGYLCSGGESLVGCCCVAC